MLDRRNHNVRHIAEFQDVGCEDTSDDLEWYGMDWAAPSPADDGLSTVEVMDVEAPLTDDLIQLLNSIDPLSLSNNFGIDIYLNCLHMVQT